MPCLTTIFYLSFDKSSSISMTLSWFSTLLTNLTTMTDLCYLWLSGTTSLYPFSSRMSLMTEKVNFLFAWFFILVIKFLNLMFSLETVRLKGLASFLGSMWPFRSGFLMAFRVMSSIYSRTSELRLRTFSYLSCRGARSIANYWF